MTVIGAGGVVILAWAYKSKFAKKLKKLEASDRQMYERALEKISQLTSVPRPPGLGFEKLKGWSNPDLYTIHVTGNYKISMELSEADIEFEEGDKKVVRRGILATLRNIDCHNEIDRAP